MEALSALIVKEGTAVMVRVRAVCGTHRVVHNTGHGMPKQGTWTTNKRKGCDEAGLGRFGQHKKHDRVPNTRLVITKGRGDHVLVLCGSMTARQAQLRTG